MKNSKRIVTFLLCFVMVCFSISVPMVASATVADAFEYSRDALSKWMTGFSLSEPLGGWTVAGWADALFASNKEQKYYTTPTESVEDKYGNVTNYYRGGDTTTTKIIDSYNKTFNTIYNTTNNTNNYSANVKLSDFLNTYTTNTNNYTYSTQLKSWYYDNTQNTYNYDASQTYYNTDNSKYYISIDNSTDEYYLVDVQYSPTFVTVNYNYYNIDNSTTYGDVTNVYYFELTDGRNSYSLTADEVAGLDLSYDVANYVLVADDPNTLSLQHFDGDYTDSSSYGRSFYSENRSTNYVDSGSFGQALKLTSGSAAGVSIPGLSSKGNLTIDFRIYFDTPLALKVYLGDTLIYYPAHYGSYTIYANQWVAVRCTIADGKIYRFFNGDLISSEDFIMSAADSLYVKSAGTLYLDELRITTGDMVSTETYTPSAAPYDTNKVLALPTELTANTIYVRHFIPVSAWRIGGVRPSNPTVGFFYVPLYGDYTGAQGQLYDGANWVDVDAVVYDGTSTSSVIGFKFTPMGASTDVDTDLEPGRPAKPGEDADQSTCSHAWEETSRTDATCTGVGSVTYTCSKCASVKTENLAKLNHTWEVKQSVQTTYDESGNVLTEGFTIYRCSVCGEEYKDTDGSGPPMSNDSDSSDSDGNWFTKLLGKIGDFFGSTIGGLLELIGSVLTGLLDGLITLGTSALAKLTEIADLFSSFGESIGALWSWLPSDIVTVLVAGVTVLIFAAVIKIFL